METKKINPMNLSDDEYKAFEIEVSKLLTTDRELYDKASEVVRRLGLGGLWRGYGASILIVAEAIMEDRGEE